MSAPDFVAVGHVTLDRFGDATRPGGAALFAAVTADRLGLSAGILTSHADDFSLDALPPRIEVVTVPAPQTTTFEHAETNRRRRMRVGSVARPLLAADVPGDWLDAGLVLLAPVVGEVDEGLAATFGDATVGAAAQGWLRALRDGEVIERPWRPAPVLLSRLQALFVSAEDVAEQQDAVREWLQQVPLGVVTTGGAGALLFVNGERYAVRPRRARARDATGAGDVFAATFLIEYHLGGDPWHAAAAATCAASLAVEGEGWATIPDRAALDAALAQYTRDY